MINAYHVTDTVPAVLFGMFALWAATSTRHWSVRTAVVAAALLVTLLIPAFEVAIEFGIECLLVVAGLAIWRRRRRSIESAEPVPLRRPFRLRPSLESLMLFVVVAAVTTAVATRVPRLGLDQW